MKAAIYSRFSTDKQTESSITDQVRVCTEYATKQSWEISHRFEDQGISGAALGNRPGVQAMMAAGANREFDVLLVMDLSRLSRSQADTPKMLDRLTFKGVRIIGIQDGYDSARKGHKLMSGISGVFGEMFRDTVSDKTRTALESRAKDGRATGGRTYGYTSKNVLVEAEALTVLEIFTRYANGETQRAIAKDLNARGVSPPRAALWQVSALHTILHNERYTGRMTWNKTVKRKDPDSGKRHTFDRPASEWVTAVREDLRIVSDEIWARVRLKDTAATYGSGNARPKYPLSGLLVCGECGRAMVIAGGINTRGFGTRRYVCRNHSEHGAGVCSNSMTVSRLVAEELLIDPIRARLLGDEKFLAAVAELRDFGGKKDPENFDQVVCAVKGARGDFDSRGSFLQSAPISPVGGGSHAGTGGLPSAVLDGRITAIERAVAEGAIPARDGASHIARLKAEHERTHNTVVPCNDDVLANVERLHAALVSAATDALRDALRRTLGTIRCVPTIDGGERYLNAVFEGGDMPLWDWLYCGTPSIMGRDTMVPRAGIEPAT
jgi:site-specific DNA recombinase